MLKQIKHTLDCCLATDSWLYTSAISTFKSRNCSASLYNNDTCDASEFSHKFPAAILTHQVPACSHIGLHCLGLDATTNDYAKTQRWVYLGYCHSAMQSAVQKRVTLIQGSFLSHVSDRMINWLTKWASQQFVNKWRLHRRQRHGPVYICAQCKHRHHIKGTFWNSGKTFEFLLVYIWT